ncbi:hypothetical protein Pan216_46520 [Planctomycetes bacterium Pan216]|uniref:VWFA domain-containing protein n=1 Tax=Kolteria novifilia TaxID=2527975 RepID=A0A518B9X2_9BACT|nr:hypothetical protein Pan216_46520 [Planctomycetes bacterium Pan216]
MEFLSPLSVWGWSAALAAPVAIVALYFLKLRRHPVEVSSTLLWRRSIEDLRVNTFWQRLRRNILLLLQLLVVMALLAALLRPTLAATKTGRRLILLLDNSASMSATDGATSGGASSRLQLAKSKATQLVEQMRDGDAAMVIAFSNVARVVSPYTANQAELRNAIASIEPTARQTDIREALSVASGLANPQKAGEEDPEAVPADLYLYSDGRFDTPEELALGNLSLTYLAMGTSDRNAGIVAFSARPDPLDPDRMTLFARLANPGSEPIEGSAVLAVDGRTIDVQSVKIPEGGEQALRFVVGSGEREVFELRLEVEDDLAVDNRAWTVVNPPRKARVLVVGDDDPPLEAVLRTEAMGRWATIERQPASFADRDLASDVSVADYDLIIFDRCTPKSMPETNTFFLGALPPTFDVGQTEMTPAPAIVTVDTSHPVMRLLSLDDVAVTESIKVAPPRGASLLVESDRGPLIFALERGVMTDLVQTFPLLGLDGAWQTDWPLKLSFPLYVVNAIRFLGGVDVEGGPSTRPGEPIEIRTGGSEEVAVVTLPDQRRVELEKRRGGRAMLLETEEPGVYRIESDEEVRLSTVNLFDRAETSIGPRETITIGAVETTDARSDLSFRWEFWRPLAVLAFLLLLFEWYVYHRRVAI